MGAQVHRSARALPDDGRLFMFYGGGYNNEPQQIGCAASDDGVRWTRLCDDPRALSSVEAPFDCPSTGSGWQLRAREPFLPDGAPGEWNASESGHPFAFTDHDGQTHPFFQGNNDRGHTWFLSRKRIVWRVGVPFFGVDIA